MPFEAEKWVPRGQVMPARPGTEVPQGLAAYFKGWHYVAYGGVYENQTTGYPRPTNARVGCLFASQDGVGWTLVLDGAAANFAGCRDWFPGALFVHNGALHCVMVAASSSWILSYAYYPAGGIIILRTTNGLTWTQVATLHTWPGVDYGSGSQAAVVVTSCAWTSARTGLASVIVGWRLSASGTGGSSVQTGTHLWQSPDGITWTFIREMRGTYPFTSTAAGASSGPFLVIAYTPSEGAPERWAMLGSQAQVTLSDNAGASWYASSIFTFPSHLIWLRSRGMVALTWGSMTGGPTVSISCNQGLSFTTQSIGGTTGSPCLAPDFGGLEQLLIITHSGGGVHNLWYSTNGGEAVTNIGTLTTFYAGQFFYVTWAHGLAIYYDTSRTVITCADAPTYAYTPRTLCPELVPPPPPPNLRVPMAPCPPPFTPVLCDQECPPEPAVVTMARMLGPLALRRQQHSAPRLFVGAETPALRVTPLAVEDIPVGATFMNIPCAPVCPSDPDLTTTCHARLGLFQLGENCLGTPGPLSALARRLAAAGRRH